MPTSTCCRIALRLVVLIAITGAGSSCSEEVLEIIEVDSVDVRGPSGSVPVGATAQFTATPKDDRGNELTNRDVTWQTSNGALASIDANGLLRALASGSVTVTATVEGVAGNTSITIDIPAPAITTINPNVATFGTAGFNLVVDGSNFAPGSVVRWNGQNRTTLFVSATRLQATIPATDLAEPGLFSVTVFTPAPGGGTSSAITFSVRIVGVQPYIEMGVQFACAVSSSTAVYCWGRNPNGQLGDGTTTDRSVPTRVSSTLPFVSVGTGNTHACALTNVGAAHCWGVGASGQLGDGTNNSRTSPVAVTGGLSFVNISVGGEHACAVTALGRAHCWGFNNSGRLGDGTTISRNAPVQVQGNLIFRSISAGVDHTCGVTRDNELYCWGSNANGQLGLGDTNPRTTPVRVTTPVPMSLVSAGNDHTCAIGMNAASYCFGENGSGQLGTGNFTDSFVPIQTSGAGGYVSISAGIDNTCALQEAGTALCWGSNLYAQIGTGAITNVQQTPVPVTGGINFKAIATGFRATCALGMNTTAYCWGSREFGQLGDGQTAHRLTPTPLSGGPAAYSTITVGKTNTFGFACALSNTGAPFCWGENGGGQLGTGGLANAFSPTAVSGGPGTFAEISAGFAHVCARTAAGTAFCWGIGFNGELGIGLSASRANPTQVTGANVYQSLSTGFNHTCGVTTAGQLFCWGENSSGQLGTGNFNDALSPVAVTGVAGLVFVQVSAGGFQTCARTNTGALYCWGNNEYGQIGDGTTAARPTPVLINVGGPISSVSAGVFHTCALRTTGAALCWGFGGVGELGDGGFLNRSVPTAVAGGFVFATLVSGRQATCGITTAGSAFCWGGVENIAGTGTIVNSTMPTVAVSGSNFSAIAPNMTFVCGIATGGGGRCWGVNTLGELGIGISGIVLAPAPVQGSIFFSPPSARTTRRR